MTKIDVDSPTFKYIIVKSSVLKGHIEDNDENFSEEIPLPGVAAS